MSSIETDIKLSKRLYAWLKSVIAYCYGGEVRMSEKSLNTLPKQSKDLLLFDEMFHGGARQEFCTRPVTLAGVPHISTTTRSGVDRVELAHQPTSGNAKLYLNPELSWINFNQRVLDEARNPRTPLLERVKFLAIASSNIDEFLMKRMGKLKQLVNAEVESLTVDGRSAEEQFALCRQKLVLMQRNKEVIYRTVLAELRRHEIHLLEYVDLNGTERSSLRESYIKNVLPLMTPMAIDLSHPFPFISNLSLNLFVAMKHNDHAANSYARVEIPVGVEVPRYIRLGVENRFVRLEEVVMENVDLLFPRTRVDSCDVFRVTRNANTENDDTSSNSMMDKTQGALLERKFASVVRLETNVRMDTGRRTMLAEKLGMDDKKDIFESNLLVRMSDLFEIAGLDLPSLHEPLHTPLDNPMLSKHRSIFDDIFNASSILLQHPYQCFVSSVGRFIYEASSDPNVVAIKMTLYRTSADTKILDYLSEAALNGKQVAVVVELSARFNEAANIRWARHLEQVGIHVNYGVKGLETHSKAILVVRQEKGGLRRYAHVGTGNYHVGTARHYSDVGLLTCNTELIRDLAELFNYLTSGCDPRRDYSLILAAPLTIKSALLSKIEREINLHNEHLPGLIRLKTNALEDPDITAALYRASCAGVKVELLVRDICRLRPGLSKLSENIKVISIVGRFLEHSRIYYFKNDGDEEYYIGSADLMTRNLEKRVEILVPIEDLDARKSLKEMLNCQIADNHLSWEMKSNGNYFRRDLKALLPVIDCQQLPQYVSAQPASIAHSKSIAVSVNDADYSTHMDFLPKTK